MSLRAHLSMILLTFLVLSLFSVSQAFILPMGNAPSGIGSSTLLHAPRSVTELEVANLNIAPDGFNRTATLVNGVFPAPLIKVNKGDHFAIRVSNQLTDPTMPLETAVHWHVIFQRKSNWADGVPWVSQCPIRQQDQFEYRFDIENQTGTYWYHSHDIDQYCDGLRGPLVIYDPDDPLAHLYDIDDENTVITLSDWYHLPSFQLGEIRGPVEANSTLINGHGRYPGGPLTPLAVINVNQGMRYRFRVISTTCDPQFNFSIDGHRMTIIEVDGNEVSPVDVDSFPIFPGQRYSVVVTADKPMDNYWIRALPVTAGASFTEGQNMAILQYEGAGDRDPTSTPGPYELAFDEGNLHTLVDPGAPGIPQIGSADVTIRLVSGINSERLFTLNNVSYVNPPVPVLLQILSGARHPSELLPKGSVYELPLNKVVEISFPNPVAAPGGPHPIHLHGLSFDVVRVAGSNMTNFENPVRRDVVSIGNSSTDEVTIRFVTDNPGPWLLHCHIDWHFHHGFAVVMAQAPELAALQESRVIPQSWYDLCPANVTQTYDQTGQYDDSGESDM